MPETTLDQWAAWLLHRRHGDDPEELRRTLARLAMVREKVLDNARLAPGETLLDVGCGDGLIAFGALERVGAEGSVILSDVSQDLLDHDRELAERLGVAERCRFVHAPAEDLAAMADASVDVVTTRSVLAYVGPKREAFAEFFRVLRPGGRLSIYEPVNRLIAVEREGTFFGFDVGPVCDLADRIDAAYLARQDRKDDPMFDYDERDLLRFAEEAGFGERHLELRIDVTPETPRPWDAVLSVAPNPLAPTLAEAMAETLTSEETARFIAHVRPLVEQGAGMFASAIAYLWAVKPHDPARGSA